MRKLGRFLFSMSFIGATLLLFGAGAQAQITPDSPKGKIRIESVQLCPGQTADVGVFVDFGDYATQEGVRAMENFMFFLYLSDTSVCEVVSSHKQREQGTAYDGSPLDYWVCEPVLKDMHPSIKCCMVNSYLYGTGWDDNGYTLQNPKAARFATTWFSNESQAFMLTDSIPLFRIRIRCKKEGVCRLEFPDYRQIVFSTGLLFLGGQYFDFRGGITHGVVDATGKGPDKSLVDAGRDSMLCVGSRFTLNGEGGTDYVWTEISGRGAKSADFLAGSKTKNPTFTPKEAGTYVFQMAAYSPDGCSTLDTVVYEVGENKITKQAISPDWNFIEAGSSLIFGVAAQDAAANYPLKVTLTPDSLFAEEQNVFEIEPSGDTVYVATMPVSEPNMVAAVFEDRYGCRAELSSGIYIKGLHITGTLSQFPIYRCGNDNSDKSIQLNVLTKGGSGKFNYRWSATNLESNVAAPVIDDPMARSPRMTYQGLCAVSVSIYDLVTGESVLISDSMEYRDWLHPSVEVEVDTLASGLVPGEPVGPFCEGTELTFKVKTLYEGDAPVFTWRINGLTQEDAHGRTFSALLNRDDSIDVIMYSTEECAAERTVQSSLFGANIRFPVYLNANVHNSAGLNDPYLQPCHDSVKYRVLAWNAGKDFKITWLRNSKEVLYEGWAHSESEDYAEADVVLPRTGFYDNYACAISQPSMPCAIFDSITTEANYLNQAFDRWNVPDYPLNVSAAAELSPIKTEYARQAACESEPITVSTDIRYLPRDFTLIWFKQPADGGDSVFLGYYRFDLEDEENSFSAGFVPEEFQGDNMLNATFDLAYILGYTGSTSMSKIRSVVADGFPLRLNDNDLATGSIPCEQLHVGGFEAGDALYYVLYTPGTECGTGLRRYRSGNFVPKLIQYDDYSDLPLELAKLGAEKNCPTAPMVVVASIPGLPDEIKPFVRYEWRFDGWITNGEVSLKSPLLEDEFFSGEMVVKGENKDTLYAYASYTWAEVTCKAVLDISCGRWGSNKYKKFNFNDYITVGAPNFTITRVEDDTILCAGSELRLWASAKENHTYRSKRKAAKAAAEYEYAWSTSLASLPKEGDPVEDGSVVGMEPSGEKLLTPAPAVVPQGYWSDWNNEDGISTYYLSVHHKSADCWAYDSVRVLSAPDKDWKVSLQLTKQGVWCDSMLEGPSAQRLYLKSDDDPGVSFAWYVNGKRKYDWKGDTVCVAGMLTSDTVSALVYTDLITCRPYQQTVELGIPYHESPVDVLTLVTPEWARAGEEVMIDAGAVYRGLWGAEDDDYVLNVNYRWEKQERDGSWTAVPASLHGISDSKYNVDTLRVVLPDYTPHYRIIAEGFRKVCPADTGFLEIPIAVSTGVGMDVVEIEADGKAGQPIYGMCMQSDDYVKVTGFEGNTGTIKDTLFNLASGKKVRVRAFPENPGAESWVMYYRNGKVYAAGPVGSTRPNPRLPEPGTVAYTILSDGEYCDMELEEGDAVYVMYGTDTLSADGNYTHYSPKYEMWRLEPNGRMLLVTDDQVVCEGGEVHLRVCFEDSVDLYGHIDKTQVVEWAPAEALQGSPKGWTAVGKPTARTLYKAAAVDGIHCPWVDTLRVYLTQEGSGVSLPFKLTSPDRLFCGEGVRTLLYAHLPGNYKDLSSLYSNIKYYVCDASGVVRFTAEGFDTIRPDVEVGDGWTAYATATFRVACNTTVSYSDTVVFRALALPVIERLLPRAADTLVCAAKPLELKYAQPEGCGFAWHSVLAPMWGGASSLNRAYRVDRSTEVVFEAYRNDLRSCVRFDTVRVEMPSGGVSGQPVLLLAASADAACGEESITYTLQKRNCDTVIWYVNSKEVARDVLTYSFVPRHSGLTGAPDTVQVYGALAPNLCTGYASGWSNVVLTRRVEKPAFTFVSPDTTVEKGATLELRAAATVEDGAPASFFWLDGQDREVSREASFRFEVSQADAYTVQAYQEEVLNLAENCLSEAVVKVSVKSGGSVVEPLRPLPELKLSVSEAWLCGEGEVTYTLAPAEEYDTLIWYENGLEISRQSWPVVRTPDYTGFGRADTVFVTGVAVDSLRPGVDTVRYRTSNVVTVHRIEKPVFVRVLPRDTLVEAHAEVLLSALATAPDGPEIVYYWSDSLGEETGEGASFRAKPEHSTRYYVMAEQYASNTFECFAEDSALVRVMGDTLPVKMGELEVYIPNTVIPYSQKQENTCLRVYGLNIKNVHLQVFDNKGKKLFEASGDAETTRWEATASDGRRVPAGTYSYKAEVTLVDNLGEEHIVNKQSWVQVIL